MNIGDLFFALRANDATLQADVKKAGTAAGGTLGSSLSGSFRKAFSGENLGKGIVQGLGLAGGLGVANIVSNIVDVFGDATRAAIEEEASIAKLDAALRANISNWDGNTDAIEATLAARMRLGFADDEQRDSLALLVAATKDYNKALELQRTAMDLARLKGISLKDASEALIKVEGGQFRLLKSLGIELKDNATQTEALAAVQAVANGQAEAYANTTGGKLLAAQVKFGEAMEKLGSATMPLVADATDAAADAVENIAADWEKLGPLALIFNDTTNDGAKAMGHLEGALSGAEAATEDVTDATEDASSEWEVAAEVVEDMEEALEDLTDAAYDAAGAFGDQMYSAQELRGRIADLTTELYEAKAALQELEAIKNPTAAQQRDIEAARGKVAGLRHDLFDTRVELAKLDKTQLDALLIELSKLQYRTDAIGDEARVALDLFQKLAFAAKNVPGYQSDPGYAPRASGGPVYKGHPYLVGEQGPELMVPNMSGTILPNAALSSGMGGNVQNNYVTVEGLIPYRDPLSIPQALQRFGESGLLDFGVLDA